MAILKCKICGGDMELSPDRTFGTCEYCGSTMTLPVSTMAAPSVSTAAVLTAVVALSGPLCG